MIDRNKIFELLKKYYEKNPLLMAGSIDNLKNLNEAEKNLDVIFSDSYREFIKLYGGAIVGASPIYGLKRQGNMDAAVYDIVSVTNFYRKQKWPGTENWYVVSDDFDGNPIGMDPEGRAWLSDHDAGFELVKLADSFEELLYRLYTETLFE